MAHITKVFEMLSIQGRNRREEGENSLGDIAREIERNHRREKGLTLSATAMSS
jgi:hypothetical protein